MDSWVSSLSIDKRKLVFEQVFQPTRIIIIVQLSDATRCMRLIYYYFHWDQFYIEFYEAIYAGVNSQ